MSRRFINELGERENLDDVFLVSEKQLRANRNGNLYLQVRLADKTGSVNGMMWNANDRVYSSFNNGDYIQVQATTQFYNGNLQLIINRIQQIDAARVDESDFSTLGTNDIESFSTKLTGMLRGISNFHLRNLAECFLIDEKFMEKFCSAPAGIKNHHAYKGGLLEHVVSLMELATTVSRHYDDLDPDLMTIGAFLHDAGKIDELTYERDLGYSDEGQLIGHLVMAVGLLDNKVKEAEKLSGEPFPREFHLRIKHMIVSHHGEYAFGSPKLPMTLEAIALHYLDNLDAKMHSIADLLETDANTDSNWTTYQPALGRKLFKGLTP